MKKFMEEFKAFALRGNVMDMAVGVIIGDKRSGASRTSLIRRKRWLCRRSIPARYTTPQKTPLMPPGSILTPRTPSITTMWPFPRCTSAPVGTNNLHRQKSCCPPFAGRQQLFALCLYVTLQADVLQDEQHGQHIHQRADLLFLGLAGDHIDDGPGDHTNGNALRDAVCSGHGQDGQEGGDALAGVVEVDLDRGAHHVEPKDSADHLLV